MPLLPIYYCAGSYDPNKQSSCGSGSSSSSSSGNGGSGTQSPSCGSSPLTGNPINFASGAKIQLESDFPFTLADVNFSRQYRSDLDSYLYSGSDGPISPMTQGAGWVPAPGRYLYIYYTPATTGGISSSPLYLRAIRPDGRNIAYSISGGVASSDADINDVLTLIPGTMANSVASWMLFTATGATETYTSNGRIATLIQKDGKSLLYTYANKASDGTLTASANGAYLMSVVDQWGNRLQYQYDANGNLAKIIDPAGRITSYGYMPHTSGNMSNWMLTSVTRPDGNTRSYSYVFNTANTADMTPYLSGITDENGNRYATFDYQDAAYSDGKHYLRAIDTYHGNGADKFAVSYPTAATDPTVVTTPLGATLSYNLQAPQGVFKISGLTQPAPSGSGTVNSNATFDINGNVIARTDANGAKTTYQFDSKRNLETQRVEAVGRPEQRTISTTWHNVWRLPTKVAEPGKITSYVYNGDGGVFCAPQDALSAGKPIAVLCSRTEQATSDANGSLGYAAAVSGMPRIWRWTYLNYGRKASQTDPLGNVTRYSYYADSDAEMGRRGQLLSITNPLGQVTRINSYDLLHNPLSMTLADGTPVSMTYNLMGQLTSRSAGAETTSFSYDKAGQLIGVTQPNGSSLTYAYDTAHRLNRVSDNLGNSVSYVLDNAGNRIGETTSDAAGNLALSISRVYDVLGQLRNIAGPSTE